MNLEFKDQINHVIRLDRTPKRIISLVPSQTEFLSYLNLDDQVIGITKFCVHPQNWFKQKTRVGGTKNIDFNKIVDLNPDLIIANKEENSQADIENLQSKYQVYTSNIANLADAFQMMEDIGGIVNRFEKTKDLISEIKKDFSELKTVERKSVLYLIWQDPYMTAGQETFINAMLTMCGLKNADVSNQRYNEISEEAIAQLNPDYIFLSSEPYPFKLKHAEKLRSLSNAKVVLVDGEMFSWYGNRLNMFKTYWEHTLLPSL